MMEGSALDLATNIGMMNRNNGNYCDGMDGFGGGWGIWILIILFFIMGAGNNGWGNRGYGYDTLTNEFLYTNLNNSIDRGFNQLANQNFGIQKDLCQGFGATQQEIANNRFAAQECCCETNRNIDSVRYENAKNTCDIITAANANTQKIIDHLTSDKIDSLRTDLQAAQLQLGNLSQTQNIINQLKPVPVPAYLTCSPYAAYNIGGFGGNCGFGGCGCNNFGF